MHQALIKSFVSAVIAYSTHYGVSKLYNAMCIPDGVWGYLQGFATTGSPVCQAGMQIMSSTQLSYSSIIMMGVSRIIVDVISPDSTKAAQ
jgi:hypothetical protein